VLLNVAQNRLRDFAKLRKLVKIQKASLEMLVGKQHIFNCHKTWVTREKKRFQLMHS